MFSAMLWANSRKIQLAGKLTRIHFEGAAAVPGPGLAVPRQARWFGVLREVARINSRSPSAL